MTSYAVLTAAGSGTRLGTDGPKALVTIAGQPMLVRAAIGLAAAGVAAIVVTAPENYVSRFSALFQAPSAHHPGSVPGYPGVFVWTVAGGQSRQASVKNGIDALAAHVHATPGLELNDTTPVLVHDAARCLTPVSQSRRVIDAVAAGRDAVIPGLPVSDTIKVVGPAGPGGVRDVVDTPDRTQLVAVQTPQGFSWKLLVAAHKQFAHLAATETTALTDDAGLVEAMGLPVYTVAGHAHAMKVTTAADLALAELIAAREEHITEGPLKGNS